MTDGVAQPQLKAAVDARRVRRPSHGLLSSALGLVGIVGFLLVWEVATRTGLINPRFLPPASDVIIRLIGYLVDRAFWRDVGETMTSWAIGLAIAVVAATIIGFAIGSAPFLEKATRSTIEFLRPIPSVALIPLAVLLFGTRIQSSLLLIVYAAFWQVLLQVIYGTLDVDPVADSTAKSYGLGRLSRLRHVVWPTTLPYLMTGVRLAATVALILAITSELIIGTPGLGKQIADTQSGGDVTGMYALVLATGLIGVAVNLVARFVERRALAWHTSVRSEVEA